MSNLLCHHAGYNRATVGEEEDKFKEDKKKNKSKKNNKNKLEKYENAQDGRRKTTRRL